MSWATDEAARIAAEQNKRAEERKWQMYAAGCIEREAPRFFELLADQIATYVAEFQSASAGANTLVVDRTETSISVTRPGYPGIHAKLALMGPRVRYFERRVDATYAPTEVREDWRFSLVKDDVLLNGSNHDDAARLFLGPVFRVF